MEIIHLSRLVLVRASSAVRIYPESPGVMEISLEINKTEAQSRRQGMKRLQTVSSACRGQWAPMGYPKGCRLQTFQVFPCPCCPSQGQSHVGGMPVSHFRGKYFQVDMSTSMLLKSRLG